MIERERNISALTARRLERFRTALARHPTGFLTTVVALSLSLWALGGWVLWLTIGVTRGLPGPEAVAGIGDMVQATTLYDADDKPVFAIFKEQRIEVPLAEVSPNVINALLAIEDQRFYDHRGVDIIRIAAALMANLRERRAAQGGSTITQQLARQSLLTREKTVRRKLRELVLATQIERAYTKAQILELYMNKVYFGDGFYGVEAAALGFLGKRASELDVAEAALLAGLVQSPSTYAPTINPVRAQARRDVVLQAMLEMKAIDASTLERAKAQPITLRNALRREEAFGLYFKEQVRLELVERFGWERVYEGGLRVYTTINPEMQKAAEVQLEEALKRIESRKGYPHALRVPGAVASNGGDHAASSYLQGALLALEPNTGFVRALVGGRSFGESRFNRATQAMRQPGSAFKPFVFTAALEAGFTPASIIANLDDPILTAQGAWMPEDEHSSATAMTLRTALRTSSNRAAVQLLQSVGIDNAVQYAGKLNVGTVPSVPSLALGAGEVTLQSLTGAYAAFANGGFVRRPILIRRVEDDQGQVLFQSADAPSRAISEATAFMMANMLADVVNAGTAHRARREGFTLPAAGKTGTTNDFVDAWFVGFTPRLVTGVWVGFDRPRTIIANGYAAELAVPVWAQFMKIATRKDEAVWLKRPHGITSVDICRVSGKLPSNACYSVEVVSNEGEVRFRSYVAPEYFIQGTEPTTGCDIHGTEALLEHIAGGAGAGPEPPPEPDVAGLAVPDVAHGADSPAATSGDVVEAPPNEEESAAPRKKRSFWDRLFGRGKAPVKAVKPDKADKADKKDEKKESPKPKPPN